jgi:regulator of replication initiation timing
MDYLEVLDGKAVLVKEISHQLAEFERQAKAIKAKEDELRAALVAEMESKGILSVDNDELTITYSRATTRETLDSKALKAELPDIYDAYAKISPVKASVKIKVK